MTISEYRKELGENGKKLFEDWRKFYGISSESDLLLLSLVADCWQSICRIRKKMSQPGYEDTRLDQDIMKSSRTQAMAAIRQLSLEIPQEDILKEFE